MRKKKTILSVALLVTASILFTGCSNASNNDKKDVAIENNSTKSTVANTGATTVTTSENKTVGVSEVPTSTEAPRSGTTETPTEPASESHSEPSTEAPYVVPSVTPVETPAPTERPTEAPTARPTEAPTEAPKPTEAPHSHSYSVTSEATCTEAGVETCSCGATRSIPALGHNEVFVQGKGYDTTIFDCGTILSREDHLAGKTCGHAWCGSGTYHVTISKAHFECSRCHAHLGDA